MTYSEDLALKALSEIKDPLKDGDIIEVDSRTSDAIAMAVRYNCPIFTFEFIMESAGVVLDEKENDKILKSSKVRDEESPDNSVAVRISSKTWI